MIVEDLYCVEAPPIGGVPTATELRWIELELDQLYPNFRRAFRAIRELQLDLQLARWEVARLYPPGT